MNIYNKYLQKCEGCTHFCEILYIYIYIYISRLSLVRPLDQGSKVYLHSISTRWPPLHIFDPGTQNQS